MFLHFADCNLWSGVERNRATAISTFCDTHFVGTNGDGGGKFRTREAMADHVAGMWRGREGDPKLAVRTGGEPLMQLDAPLTVLQRPRWPSSHPQRGIASRRANRGSSSFKGSLRLTAR